MLHGRLASKPGGYLLADDWSPSAPAVMAAWARAVAEGWVREVLCVDGPVVDGARKGYCLGVYEDSGVT